MNKLFSKVGASVVAISLVSMLPGNAAEPKIAESKLDWDSKVSVLKMKPGGSAKHSYGFKNLTGSGISIKRVKSSCSCTASRFTKGLIPDGGSGFVEIEMSAGDRKEDFAVTSYVEFDNGAVVKLDTKGLILGRAKIEPNLLVWKANDRSEKIVKVYLGGDDELRLVNASLSNSDYSLTTVFLEEERTWEIKINNSVEKSSAAILTLLTEGNGVETQNFILLKTNAKGNKDE